MKSCLSEGMKPPKTTDKGGSSDTCGSCPVNKQNSIRFASCNKLRSSLAVVATVKPGGFNKCRTAHVPNVRHRDLAKRPKPIADMLPEFCPVAGRQRGRRPFDDLAQGRRQARDGIVARRTVDHRRRAFLASASAASGSG
jgi:hypothetical protein